jgi:alpha-ketoglutarate-dependent taurine dioxygenase
VHAIEIRTITPSTTRRFQRFVDDLVQRYGSASDPEFLRSSTRMALELDKEIWGQCRPSDPVDGTFVLRGLDVPEDRLGRTPGHWSRADPETTAPWDMAMVLLGSVMGRVFGWEGQQDGRIVHHIVPTAGSETEQTGASSTVELTFHTEDSFHPARSHVMMLGCLRNPDNVPTRISSVRHVELDAEDYRVLSKPRVRISPDSSYDDEGSGGAPTLVRTLWPTRDGWCMRYDPAYSQLPEGDQAFGAAYGRLTAELHEKLTPVALQPGDIAVVDNDVVVHGRAPFRARYDGNDRWLTRVSVQMPWRSRPASEDLEHGYGQEIVDVHSEAVLV